MRDLLKSIDHLSGLTATLFYLFFLFEVMSLCKWRSYFSFIESGPIGMAATWSQHKKHLRVAKPASLLGIKYAIRTQEVFIKPQIDNVNSSAWY